MTAFKVLVIRQITTNLTGRASDLKLPPLLREVAVCRMGGSKLKPAVLQGYIFCAHAIHNIFVLGNMYTFKCIN